MLERSLLQGTAPPCSDGRAGPAMCLGQGQGQGQGRPPTRPSHSARSLLGESRRRLVFAMCTAMPSAPPVTCGSPRDQCDTARLPRKLLQVPLFSVQGSLSPQPAGSGEEETGGLWRPLWFPLCRHRISKIPFPARGHRPAPLPPHPVSVTHESSQ